MFDNLDSETAGTVKCKDCKHAKKTIVSLECHAFQQDDYLDRLGSDNWSSSAVVRRFHCHGTWFEPRIPRKQRFLGWLRNL